MKQIKRLLEREIIRYGLSGAIVTFLNTGMYFLLLQIGVVYLVANLISLILSKTAAYILNKLWVYQSKNKRFSHMICELFRFMLTRGFTGIVDFFGLLVMVEWYGINERVSKIVVMVFVMILNYILGKKIVFKEK